MVTQPETEYWRLIAQSLELEDRKLRQFVRHNPSLGVGRESILRDILCAQTPEPYRVKTGFVAGVQGSGMVLSDQCDILVYDPTISKPLYGIDEFVVVSYRAARIAVEVKSQLTVWQRPSLEAAKSMNPRNRKISALDQMFKVWRSMTEFGTQVFGFAYAGVKFDAFVDAVATRVAGDVGSVPECIVVHKQNYVCVRVTKTPVQPDPRLCIAIDFSQSKVDRSGLATAYFLGLYDNRVRSCEMLSLDSVETLLRNLTIPPAAVRIIAENGQITQGPIPT